MGIERLRACVRASQIDETRSTLMFASRAKNVKNNARVNEVLDDKALLNKYKKEILDLQKQLEMAKGGVVISHADAVSSEDLATLVSQKQKVRKVLARMLTRRFECLPTAMESYMCHQIRTAEHPLTLPFIQVEQQNQELATKLTHLSQLMLGAPLPMGESACAREVVAKTAKKPCRRVTFGHYGERAQTNRRASAVTGLSSGGNGVSRPFASVEACLRAYTCMLSLTRNRRTR